jgi:hypothetical protein
MNILLIVLAVIGVLVLLLLVIGLFSRKGYSISRTITISRPVNEVFNYIKHLKNQDHFNKWVMMDPAMNKDFKGTDGTEGFIYGWDGNKKAGAGEQEIMKIRDQRRIDMQVRFRRPFEAVADSYMETSPAAETPGLNASTKLQWGFSSNLKYPANIFLLFMNIDKTLGKDMDHSLSRLKTILEN